MKIKEIAIRLEAVYELFRWKWRRKMFTPDAQEIEGNIRDLLKSLKKHDDKWEGTVSSGGLRVYREDNALYVSFNPTLDYEITGIEEDK